METKDKNINRFISSLSGVGIIVIVIFSFKSLNFWSWISIGLMIALSTFLVGSLIGFLFGIPRVNSKFEHNDKKEFIANTSLEEIADWLTKIIVGLGLIHINKIPNFINELAKNIVSGITRDPLDEQLCIIFTIFLIIFYFLLGFFFAFFYARLELKKKFVDVESYNNELQQQKELNKRLDEKVDRDKELLSSEKVKLKNVLSNFQKSILRAVIESEKKEYIKSSDIPYNEYKDIKELVSLNVLQQTDKHVYRLSEIYKDLNLNDIY